jgi:hypothetical protein
MTNRSTSLLAGVAILSMLAVALPRAGVAQSDPLTGTWQLNPAKSKYSPGPAPKSQTVTIEAQGQNHKLTLVAVDAAGKSTTTVIMRAYDGTPHPVTGNPAYDAESAARADANTVIISRTKAGKPVEIDTMSVSSDGKTRTLTTTGIDASGHPIGNSAVFDKQ